VVEITRCFQVLLQHFSGIIRKKEVMNIKEEMIEEMRRRNVGKSNWKLELN